MTDTAELSIEGRILLESAEPRYLGLTATAWMRVLLVAIPFLVLFRFNLVRLWLKTNPFTGQSNWAHACVVPLIGLYYLYVNREALRKAEVRPSWWGVPILVMGIALFAFGIWPGQNDFVKDFGMIMTLFGVVAALAGWGVMRTTWFPIVFLLCAIPWPDQLYPRVAGPLQALAAKASTMTLRATGVRAENLGTRIMIEGAKPLNVAEACAGLRSLMTFITIGGGLAFLSNRPMWQKIVITASAVPVAIACNVMRVCGQGLLHKHVSQQISESFFHSFVGLIMLIPGFFLILLVGWILDKLFLEETDTKRLLAAAAARKRGLLEDGAVLEMRRPAPAAAKAANRSARAASEPAKAADGPGKTADGPAKAANGPAPAPKPAPATTAPAPAPSLDLAAATRRLSSAQARPRPASTPAPGATQKAAAPPRPASSEPKSAPPRTAPPRKPAKEQP